MIHFARSSSECFEMMGMGSMSVCEENLAIIEKAQQGNEDAWRDLVKKYFKLIWSATMQYFFSEEEREDIVQDVFCKLVHNIKSYNPDKAKYSVFITVITKRTCIDRLRKIKNNREDPISFEELAERNYPVSVKEDLIDKIHKKHLVAVLQKVLAEKLTAEQRLVIRLFYYGGCSYSEIVKIMNRDETWVRNSLERTRKYLKEILAGYES
jgi:RNA polymerase sigma factor (sigma-70 family)